VATSVERCRSRSGRSGHQFGNHTGVLDAGELEVEAEVAVGEPLVVEAEQLQHGRVEVADVHRVALAATPRIRVPGRVCEGRMALDRPGGFLAMACRGGHRKTPLRTAKPDILETAFWFLGPGDSNQPLTRSEMVEKVSFSELASALTLPGPAATGPPANDCR
jgi:hypothetical protein